MCSSCWKDTFLSEVCTITQSHNISSFPKVSVLVVWRHHTQYPAVKRGRRDDHYSFKDGWETQSTVYRPNRQETVLGPVRFWRRKCYWLLWLQWKCHQHNQSASPVCLACKYREHRQLSCVIQLLYDSTTKVILVAWDLLGLYLTRRIPWRIEMQSSSDQLCFLPGLNLLGYLYSWSKSITLMPHRGL